MLQDQNPSSPILSLPTSSAADRNSFADRKTPIKTPLNIRRPLRPNNSTPLPYPSTPRNNPASNQVSSQMFNSSLNANALAPKPTLVIWGTAVNVEDTKNAFLHFLNDFELSYKTENLSTDKFYVKLFQDLFNANSSDDNQNEFSFNLNLDCENLKCFAAKSPEAEKLYCNLQRYPQEVIPIMDFAATQFALDQFDNQVNMSDAGIKVRPFNLGRKVNMRELDPADIDQLVTVKGLLIRASPVIPDMKVAFFKCNVCAHVVEEPNDRGRINEPTVCPNESCRSVNSVQIIHNRCTFSNKQIAKVQETPDETPDGQTPYTVSMFVYDELVDVGKPGDRLELTAIFRGVPVRVNPRQRAIKPLFKTYLDIVHIRKADDKRLNVDKDIANSAENLLESYEEGDRSNEVTQEEVQKFVNLSTRTDLYDLLAHSVAPSIFGLDDVKKGALLQLFGGAHKFKQGELGTPRIRGDINILLIGDPGVSKSQLLQYVHKLAPRGIYTSGKGSSAVGLTAYVTRDPDTRQLVLESGALVLSDGGVCCIDEFDKMSDHTRSVLHEEQQTISIAKAGIITTLNARTSILASANPINSKFDPKRSVVENINLAPPLLSRFDLIFLLLDTPNADHDRQLARHIVGLYLSERGERIMEQEVLSIEFFTKYINYAREFVNPRISEQAGNSLIEKYVNMRRMGKLAGRGKTVTGTTRQLESMIRLAEAHARMRLSPIVQPVDVDEAHRIIEEAMMSSAIDPLTGLVDVDLIQTGSSSRHRDIEEQKRNQLRRIINSIDKPTIRYMELYNAFREDREDRVNEKEFDGLVGELADMDFITVTGKVSADKVIRRKF